jgi:hypothetical protein
MTEEAPLMACAGVMLAPIYITATRCMMRLNTPLEL